MSAQRKVCVVVTARASYARVRSALAAVRDHPMLELQLVMAASALLERYGNAASVVEDEGFEVARRVHTIVEGESLITSAKSTGLGLVELSTVFADLRPDVVVTIADRFETMASAVAAAYMNIPLAHIQGGEITGSIDEKVRHAVTKLADQHFVATDRARERVIRMGERPESVHMTGCPSLDLAKRIAGRGQEAPLAGRAIPGVGPDVDLTADYVVVLQHPVTTEHDRAYEQVLETLHAVDGADIPALWFWPNVDAGSDGTSKGIRTFRETRPSSRIHFLRNLPPEDFLRLLAQSRCIVGNSSVAIRECSFLGVPAVNIGTRQAGRDRGRNVMDCDYDRAAITRALNTQIQRGAIESERLYGDGEAGRRIAELLATVELTHEKQLAY